MDALSQTLAAALLLAGWLLAAPPLAAWATTSARPFSLPWRRRATGAWADLAKLIGRRPPSLGATSPADATSSRALAIAAAAAAWLALAWLPIASRGPAGPTLRLAGATGGLILPLASIVFSAALRSACDRLAGDDGFPWSRHLGALAALAIVVATLGRGLDSTPGPDAIVDLQRSGRLTLGWNLLRQPLAAGVALVACLLLTDPLPSVHASRGGSPRRGRAGADLLFVLWGDALRTTATCALFVTAFLGGWDTGPIPLPDSSAATSLLTALAFLAKLILVAMVVSALGGAWRSRFADRGGEHIAWSWLVPLAAIHHLSTVVSLPELPTP